MVLNAIIEWKARAKVSGTSESATNNPCKIRYICRVFSKLKIVWEMANLIFDVDKFDQLDGTKHT